MKRPLLAILILVSLLMIVPSIKRPALALPDPGQTTVQVWSNACRSSNITITNPSCGVLDSGNTINVEINATNAPEFNGYEFWLFYDPAYLHPTALDLKSGTVFGSPFANVNDTSEPGTVRMSVINLGSSFAGGNGTLMHITFTILGVGVSPLALAAGMTSEGTSSKSWTRLVLGGNPIDTMTSDGYFKNDPTRLGPVASFTFSPAIPEGGSLVTFDASTSFDPDSSVPLNSYAWDFGDGVGATNVTSPTVTHSFGSVTGTPFIGNFSVRLIVADGDERFQGIKVQRIFVQQRPVHDIEVLSISIQPAQVEPGENVSIAVTVRNEGTFQEVFNLTVTYGPPTTLLAQVTQQTITPQTTVPAYTFTLRTTGLAPTTYEITANATIPIDDNPSNNSQRGIVTVAQGGGNSFLILAIGVIAAAVAIVVVSLILRRRRKDTERD